MILYNGCHRINQSSIQSMHFGISYGIWIDCCIIVCSLNSLCSWKSSASSGWNVNSCLEKKISHSNNIIIFIVWSFAGSLVSSLLINEFSSCSIVPIYASLFKLDWLTSLAVDSAYCPLTYFCCWTQLYITSVGQFCDEVESTCQLGYLKKICLSL